MHRGAQVFSAAVAAVRAQVEGVGTHVFEHRVLSLDNEQDELPAISLDYGEESPLTEVTGEFRARLPIEAAVMVRAPTEAELHEKLWELLAETHVALMANSGTLGLSFVVMAHRGPVGAPETASRGSQLVGIRRAIWFFDYAMDLADPN